jgi:predicted nucleotidyltransferase
LEGDRLFRKFFALEVFLKSNLQKEIDLGIASALKPIVRERIAKEIQYV